MDVQKSIFLKSASLVTGLTKVWAGVNDTVTELATAGASLPSGLIAIWRGSTSTIPDGWVLCDGQNGTPDLRDKFVLGAGNSYSVGNTGGEETHILTVNEMPTHKHSTSGSSYGSFVTSLSFDTYESRDPYSIGSGSTHPNSVSDLSTNSDSVYLSISQGSAGGSSAHNNMPPYYALCYIMKT